MPKPPAPDNTLYLIDGHAQIFRAYYAIRGGMSSPVTGEPTNATFAFTGMLLKLFSQFTPTYVAMAVDAPGRVFREDLYPDYKANRAEAPEDLAPQVTRILEITRLFGVPVLAQEGVEADDLIASATRELLADPDHPDVQVRLVSKDKDLEQLLGPRVAMFDIHTDTTIDADTLLEKKGITPDQAVELQVLTGDSVDNIPGVPGIGPKTAAKLIQQYGTVDNLVAHLDEIKGKRRENIEAAMKFFGVARKLVTLDDALSLGFELGAARVEAIDAAGLEKVFKQLGFNRHITDLRKLLEDSESLRSRAVTAGAKQDRAAEGLFAGLDAPVSLADTELATAADCEYTAVTTEKQLRVLVETLRAQPMVSVDAETIGLGHRAELCGLCFAWAEKRGVYVPMRSPDPGSHLSAQAVLAGLGPVLGDPSVPKCGHNLKYDLLVLREAGVHLRGIAFDTMVAAFLAGAPGQKLDELALAMLGHETIPITRLIGDRPRTKSAPPQRTMDQVPLDQITPYAAEDADIALRLYHLLAPKLEQLGMARLAAEVEMPLVEVLAEMEAHGIRVDPATLDEQRAGLETRIDQLRDQILEAAGEPFNVDSPRQLADVLFNKLKLPVVKRTKTGPSTDIEVLERLSEMDELEGAAARVPPLVVEYRQLTKLVGTYLAALKESIDPQTGRVHATFHQSGAATGRLSSSGPNLQNIPVRTEIGRNIRRAFVAEPGCRLVSADYSQIELRMLAHLAEDDALIEAFRSGQDIHTAVAAQVFGVEPEAVTPAQRGHAKTINFGIIYGVTAYGLARRIEGLDRAAAQKLIDDYKARFTGIDRFLAQCVEHAKAHGYVTTILGRRRAIPQIDARNPQARALGERLAINTVVQGSAADLIKAAMVRLHRRLRDEGSPARLLLQIHDELVLEAPDDAVDRTAEVVRDEMESAMALRVPLTVELGIGRDWYDAK